MINHIGLHGVCIIKLNNLCSKKTIDVLFLLSCMFEKVYTIKPITSNFIKNDVYIVCKNYLDIHTNTNKNFIVEYTNNYNKNQFIKIPCYFLNKIEEFNVVIGQQQIETIDNFINLLNLNYSANNRATLAKKITSNNKQTCNNNNNNMDVESENVEEDDEIKEKEQEEEKARQPVGEFKKNVDRLFFSKIKYKKEKLDHLENSNIQKCISWCDRNNIPYKKHAQL